MWQLLTLASLELTQSIKTKVWPFAYIVNLELLRLLNSYSDTGDQPSAPNLKILDVNVVGVAYTCKLARFYFLQHELTPDRDRCFIALSSAAGYADVPGRLVYMMSKFAVRGAMRCLRRGTVHDGIRACALAPW